METAKMFLEANKGVTLLPAQTSVILKLDSFFRERGQVSHVTSGVRTSESQLRVIREYCLRKNLTAQYPEIMKCGVEDKFTQGDIPDGNVLKWHPIWKLRKHVYAWQFAWSKLLTEKILISPPVRAECLFEYVRNGKNYYMKEMPPSNHIITGTNPHGAIDIGGGEDGISDEVEIVSEAMRVSPGIGIRSMVLERENNCLHLNIL